jgi:hypothetical protein
MQKEKSMAQFEPEEIGKAIKVLAKSLVLEFMHTNDKLLSVRFVWL